MPEIDSDLFQVLTLALLFLTLLTLLAALSVLGGIKKKLDSGGSPQVAPSETGRAEAAYQAPVATYEPVSTYATPAPEPAQEVSTGFVSMADATPAPVAAAQPAGQTAVRADDPEEQPFERDGRWWFKRGGELLVYDESTGQWVASATAAAGSGPASVTTTTPTLQSDVGEGWKCSSCGAVNGSTATSCRMCFAAR